MKKYIVSIGLSLVFLAPVIVKAQQADLRSQIAAIAKPAKGIVGVSVLGIEDRDTLSYNGNARLVMQSVMKFPIALTIMHWVDTGKITLNQMVHISKKDLPKTYSPLRDKYPKGNVDVSISDLLGYMVSLSDNDACDILLGVLKGPQTVQDYMLRSGIRGIAVRASEADMASSWELQYTNWCKPTEMTNLLDAFYTGKLLTKPSTDFLYKLMADANRLPRLKALLPPATVVAHRTGTSGTSPEGLSPATNDVGIITLPNGKHIAVAVFVCNSTADETTREAVISKIAKAVYDAHAK